jgi:hypothetical protein
MDDEAYERCATSQPASHENSLADEQTADCKRIFPSDDENTSLG